MNKSLILKNDQFKILDSIQGRLLIYICSKAKPSRIDSHIQPLYMCIYLGECGVCQN